MLLTSQQQNIVRLAFAKAKCPGDAKWGAGGLLAQIALLTGSTSDDLAKWDAASNGHGALTVQRLQESRHGFAGWPLDVLEALDRAWRAGQDKRALDAILARYSEPQTQPSATPVPQQPTSDGDGAVTYSGPERRGAFTVAVDIKSILMLIALIGPLVAVITMVLQVRQDVRGNSVRATVLETRMQSLESRVAEAEKARTIFCAGRRAAMSRDRGDSAAIRIPDAGC